jgi:hypothetical protein
MSAVKMPEREDAGRLGAGGPSLRRQAAAASSLMGRARTAPSHGCWFSDGSR